MPALIQCHLPCLADSHQAIMQWLYFDVHYIRCFDSMVARTVKPQRALEGQTFELAFGEELNFLDRPCKAALTQVQYLQMLELDPIPCNQLENLCEFESPPDQTFTV